MAQAVLEDRFVEVVAGIAAMLKTAGYAKSGKVFRRLRDGNCAVIEFQRSQSSTAELIRFTLNIGVVCGLLRDPEAPSVSKAREIDADLRSRIGSFLPDHPDRWWDLSASTDTAPIVAEIGEILTRDVAPYLDRYLANQALLELWESGRSPGMTDGQRVRKLRELKAALGC